MRSFNGAIFGFSSPSFFDVDRTAKAAVRIGSIASGVGLVVDVWFIVVYGDATSFAVRPRAAAARDRS